MVFQQLLLERIHPTFRPLQRYMRKTLSALSSRAITRPPIRPFTSSIPKMAAAASNSTPNTLAVPVNKTAHEFDKTVLDATLYRRFFFTPAFEIYGGELVCWNRWGGELMSRYGRSVRLRSARIRPPGQHP